jgi:hypothetical protein
MIQTGIEVGTGWRINYRMQGEKSLSGQSIHLTVFQSGAYRLGVIPAAPLAVL